MKTADLHDEVCASLFGIGAVTPESLLPADYTGKIADAVFPESRTIVEVKSLCKDRMDSEEVEAGAAGIFDEWTSKGGPIIFGTVNVGFTDLPPEMAQELLDLITGRIKSNLRDANRQIRATAEALGWEDVSGVVAIVTPATFKTHLGIIAHAAGRYLSHTDNAPMVDGVWSIAVPVSDAPEELAEPMAFVPHPRSGRRFERSLTERAAYGWFDHYGERTGKDMRRIPLSEADFDTMFMQGAPRPKAKWKLD